MATRSDGSGIGGGRAGGGGGGSGGGRRAPDGDDEEERHRIRSVAAKKWASQRWTNWERTPPPWLAPYAVGARMAPVRAREPVLLLSPPPVTWDVGEASSSASVGPIAGRRHGDLEEEAELARALAESTATAAAKKRREEEETTAAVAAVELFKQQEELKSRAWAQGDGEVATGEGDVEEAKVIVVDSD
jgi:hypothetical protein